MATAIEPCPFCHSHHLHLTHSGLTYCVVCERCKSMGPHWESLEEAIDRWNQTSRAQSRSDGVASEQRSPQPAQRIQHFAG